VRVTVGPAGWRAEHVLFDRNVSLPSPPTPEEMAQILSEEYVTDVHSTESLAMNTYAALNLLPISHRSDRWVGRSAILDKWRVSGVLRDLGLRTPDTLLADGTSADEAVAKLSLPIVLKSRVDASGSGVNVFDTLASLRTFFATIQSPNDWFFEQFIHGESLVCASCVSDEGIEVIATYEVLKSIYPRGPSSVVKFRNDAKLEESARTLIDALHIRGLMCFDIIRDSNGVDWIHDVNLRVFSGFSMSQLVGFDFRGAYIRYLLGHGVIQPSRLDALKAESFAFPQGGKDMYRAGARRTAWLRSIQWTWRYWRLLGSRYFLYFTINRPVSSIQRTTARLRRRSHQPHGDQHRRRAR